MSRIVLACWGGLSWLVDRPRIPAYRQAAFWKFMALWVLILRLKAVEARTP